MTRENEQFESVETQDQETSTESRAPWKTRFGADESLKQRKYSRASRNQPIKEASTMSKVLLAVLVLTVLTPFLLFWLVKSNATPNTVEPKTAQQINMARNESTTVTQATTTAANNIVQGNDQVSSVDVNNATVASVTTVAEVPVTEATVAVTQAPAGRSHTVAAGETWYGIARSYGVDVNALAAANGTSTAAAIYPGQVLIIP
ncbi:TPA: LysM peptidoglycan-binding domain-containing protein [Streptococcus suis]